MFTCWDNLDNFIVMNLDHQTDRLNHMQREMNKIGKKFVRLSASKPGDMINLKIFDYANHPNVINHPKTAIGISVLRCLEYAMENNWDYAVICEDDIEFKDVDLTRKHFDEFIKLGIEWDVICLHAIFLMSMQSIEKYYGRLRAHYGLGCMVVHKNYYKRLYYAILLLNYGLLKSVEEKYFTDHLENEELNRKWYMILPMLCWQNSRKYGCTSHNNATQNIYCDKQTELNKPYLQKFPDINY